jgi:hypothetical protein
MDAEPFLGFFLVLITLTRLCRAGAGQQKVVTQENELHIGLNIQVSNLNRRTDSERRLLPAPACPTALQTRDPVIGPGIHEFDLLASEILKIPCGRHH